MTILKLKNTDSRFHLWAGATVLFACISVAAACHAANVGDGHAAFTDKDYTRAMEILKPFAEEGDIQAQMKVGFMYFYGEGVDQDYSKASFWLSHASDSGNPIAQTMLAKMYHYGWGVEEDPQRAFALCQSAAQNGYAEAQAHLGILYAEGLGVNKNIAASVEWLYRAGISYLNTANRQMALSMVDTIRQVSPDNYMIYRLLNEIYNDSGEDHMEP